MRKILLAVVFMSIVTGSSPAAAETFKVDTKYSTVMFKIKHTMGFAAGAFTEMEGAIELDEKNTALQGITGTIKTASVDTRHKERDEDLRSDRFFDAEKYPQITFATKKISADKLTADLTIKGVTKSVTFDYSFYGTGKDQYGNTKTGISLKGTINRKDFGIDFNMKTEDGSDLLGDEVELLAELHGLLQ